LVNGLAFSGCGHMWETLPYVIPRNLSPRKRGAGMHYEESASGDTGSQRR
jgi:hypothetical protein